MLFVRLYDMRLLILSVSFPVGVLKGLQPVIVELPGLPFYFFFFAYKACICFVIIYVSSSFRAPGTL